MVHGMGKGRDGLLGMENRSVLAGENSAQEKRAAALVCARNAESVADGRLLLDALGLLHDSAIHSESR